jgi:hypothetical protein
MAGGAIGSENFRAAVQVGGLERTREEKKSRTQRWKARHQWKEVHNSSRKY